MVRRAFLKAAAALGAGVAAAPVAAAAQGAPLIDFHTHIYEPSLSADVARTDMRPEMAARLAATLKPELHLERMQRLGIDMHVLHQAAAVQGITWGDARKDLEVHRRVSDTIAETWIEPHPDKFLASFGVPTQDLSLALPEIERMAGMPGFRLLQVSSQTPDGRYYGDPSLDPLLEAVQHFGLILFIHPHLQNKTPPLDQYYLFNSVGQGIEEAKVMSNLIFQGAFEKFPKLKVLIAHGGGFLPHYPGRMDRNYENIPGVGRNLKALPSTYLKRFWYDSCVYSPAVLGNLAKAVGSDRIVLGGDFPFGGPEPVAEIRQGLGASKAETGALLARNGARLVA